MTSVETSVDGRLLSLNITLLLLFSLLTSINTSHRDGNGLLWSILLTSSTSLFNPTKKMYTLSSSFFLNALHCPLHNPIPHHNTSRVPAIKQSSHCSSQLLVDPLPMGWVIHIWIGFTSWFLNFFGYWALLSSRAIQLPRSFQISRRWCTLVNIVRRLYHHEDLRKYLFLDHELRNEGKSISFFFRYSESENTSE